MELAAKPPFSLGIKKAALESGFFSSLARQRLG